MVFESFLSDAVTLNARYPSAYAFDIARSNSALILIKIIHFSSWLLLRFVQPYSNDENRLRVLFLYSEAIRYY